MIDAFCVFSANDGLYCHGQLNFANQFLPIGFQLTPDHKQFLGIGTRVTMMYAFEWTWRHAPWKMNWYQSTAPRHFAIRCHCIRIYLLWWTLESRTQHLNLERSVFLNVSPSRHPRVGGIEDHWVRHACAEVSVGHVRPYFRWWCRQQRTTHTTVTFYNGPIKWGMPCNIKHIAGICFDADVI